MSVSQSGVYVVLKRNAIRTASGPPAAPEAEIDAPEYGAPISPASIGSSKSQRVIQLLMRVSGRSCQGARFVTDGKLRLATGRVTADIYPIPCEFSA